MKPAVNHPMTPLEGADSVGLDAEFSIAESLYEETKDAKYALPLLLTKMVAEVPVSRARRHIGACLEKTE